MLLQPGELGLTVIVAVFPVRIGGVLHPMVFWGCGVAGDGRHRLSGWINCGKANVRLVQFACEGVPEDWLRASQLFTSGFFSRVSLPGFDLGWVWRIWVSIGTLFSSSKMIRCCFATWNMMRNNWLHASYFLLPGFTTGFHYRVLITDANNCFWSYFMW